jgi:hypothetical protein
VIEISRLKDLNAADLFLGFRIGAVGRDDFAVFPGQGQRGLRRLKSYFGNKMSVSAQMVIVLKAFVEHCVALVLGHPLEFPLLDVSQTDEFHRSPPGGSQRHSLARGIVHPIVVAHQKNRQPGRTIFIWGKLKTIFPANYDLLFGFAFMDQEFRQFLLLRVLIVEIKSK